MKNCGGHEHINTKMVYHACSISYDANFLIKCLDTDILIVMLSNMKHLKTEGIRIWLEMGFGSNPRSIDVTELYLKLGAPISQSLTGLHATTGCETNPALYRKGK